MHGRPSNETSDFDTAAAHHPFLGDERAVTAANSNPDPGSDFHPDLCFAEGRRFGRFPRGDLSR